MRVYHHPGLRGLEIWQGLARHSTLDQLRHDKPAYFAGLNDFLRDLHAGRAATAAGDSLTHAAGFERLLLAGGDAQAASACLQLPHECVAPGPFAARAGAEAVWRELGWHNPAAFDLGQTRLKIFTPHTSLAVERDETWLPFGRDALPTALGRARLVEWLAAHLPPNADGLLLALPNAIHPNGVAESSTYPGLHGPLDFLHHALCPSTPCLAVNDALLAARGYPPPANEKTLLVTLGFGVGAALWH